MSVKENAKSQIEQLVKTFAEKEEFYKSQSYTEENIKVNFITPFFRALGWDTENKNSYEVFYEDRTRIKERIKRPDYGFYLNSKRQFFVEAKAAHEDLKQNWELAYQLKAYGWSAKLKISVLTDFEEFAVYDCRYAPKKLDSASQNRIKYINYKNYIKEFDYLWNNFSRESVLNGSLNGLVKDVKNIEKQAVDALFLDYLEEERSRLAGELAKLNPKLSEFELNECLIKLINRIVFLRIAEDRDIESYGELQNLVKNSKKEKSKIQDLELIYPALKGLFVQANEKYNSEMFVLTSIDEALHVKDKVLYDFIENLYYPNSPYAFDAISIDVLGSTYERFLGSIITLNPQTHKVTIEQKPEVRKAGGVYYTPKYIVDYIVENTVGELIKNKSPKEVAKIKILDPACGSGSFLIGAYEYLLDWHLQYYTQASPKEQKNNIEFIEEKPRLTIKVKKEILLNNIFGVDIDEQAVNVTKLSLCLKCLEGETQFSLRTQLALFQTQALPTLKNNIKCGNSLINTNFSLFDKEYNNYTQNQKLKINLFDWDSIKYGFGNIVKQSGFDAIIGNPPYGAELKEQERNYLEKEFGLGNTDTAALFMLQQTQLLSKNGIGSFIIPKPFIYASNWKKTRENLIDNIDLIIDVSKVWKEVKLEQIIYRYNKNKISKEYITGIKNKKLQIETIGKINKKLYTEFDFILSGVSENEIEIAQKMRQSKIFLNDLVINQRGAMLQSEVVEVPPSPLNRGNLNEQVNSKIEMVSNPNSKAPPVKGAGGYTQLKEISTHFEHGGFRYSKEIAELADIMRKAPTPAEKYFWDNILRSSQLGFKFTRQKPIHNFILDFYCSELLLGIEADGDIHDLQQEQDQLRTEYLESIGIKILRFKNEQIFKQTEKVKTEILNYINQRKRELSRINQTSEALPVKGAGRFLPVLGGKQINRYLLSNSIKGYIDEKTINDNKAYIKPNSILVQNIVAHIQNPIDHLQIIACLASQLEGSQVILDTINQLQNKSNLSSEFIIGILNSKLISWFVYLFICGKAIRTIHFDSPVTSKIPVPEIDLKNKIHKKQHDNLVVLIQRIINLKEELNNTKEEKLKNILEMQIERADKEIDKLVYDLYGLTDEEIKIVERAG